VVDGILILIHKPTSEDFAESKCKSGTLFCGRKHNFGLNCQAMCYVRGGFIYLSNIFPRSTSDLFAFEGTWPGLSLGTG
jgi:hypothetical protein